MSVFNDEFRLGLYYNLKDQKSLRLISAIAEKVKTGKDVKKSSSKSGL